MTRAALLTLILSIASLAGCARDRQPLAPVAQVQAGAYANAFSATRDELRRLGFALDRVDARAGVITTHPRSSAGLATPWEKQESNFRQEVDNLIHRQRRRVAVTFRAETQAGQTVPDDLREWGGPIRAAVIVTIDRVYRFGVQPQTASIRLSSVAADPALVAAGAQPGFAVEFEDDPWLAGRIAGRISAELADSASTP